MSSTNISQLVIQARNAARTGNVSSARKLYRNILANVTDNHTLLLEYGILEAQNGNFKQAERNFKKALKLAPDNPDANFNMGQLAHAKKQYDEAAKYLAKTLELDPQYADAEYSLGECLALTGHYEQALEHLNRALSINPNDHECLAVKGSCLLKLKQFDKAIKTLGASLDIAPENADIHARLALALSEAGNGQKAAAIYDKLLESNKLAPGEFINAARTFFKLVDNDKSEQLARQALKLHPDSRIAAILLLAELELRRGNAGKAEENARLVISLNRDAADAYFILAKLKKLEMTSIGHLKKVAEDKNSSEDNRAMAYRTLYHLYHQKKNYRDAFEALKNSNILSTPDQDPNSTTGFITRIKRTFTPEFLQKRANEGYDGKGAVFIVGMPRSGTTLTEQILAAHPQVQSGGERIDVNNAWRYQQGFPESCQDMAPEFAAKTGKTIYDAMFAGAEGKTVATDKLPGNYKVVGFIKWLLPHARFIFCHRNPCDNALSLFEQNFNNMHPYSGDLTEIARVYNDHLMIMDHWINTCKIEVLGLDYDRLVNDLERHARTIIAHAGLDWDPACLTPHLVKRDISTSSYIQVRQPVSNKSVNRWKIYEKQMQPFLDALNGDC